MQFKNREKILETLRYRTYRYRFNDRLDQIAIRYLGDIKYIKYILFINEINDPYSIVENTELKIPIDIKEADKMVIE